MKKLLSGLTAETVRPIVYKCVARCVIALTAILLWRRYANSGLKLDDGAFAAALVFFGLAWAAYLRADGLEFHFLLEERRKKSPRKRHFTKDIVDFADEHIVSFDELSEEEKLTCSFMAYLASGLIFLVPALVGMLLR